ncbi:hypothetical protein MMC25_002432 [Agyrium rufum]|nr:hypothetical protein [Agyrium rufum]
MAFLLCALFKLIKPKDKAPQGAGQKSAMSQSNGQSRATATINGRVIADATHWEVVEGNIYFPLQSIDQSILSPSNTSSTCPWKGRASYYNLNINGQTINDAAWYYPEPSDAASNLRGTVAFYGNKVQIQTY